MTLIQALTIVHPLKLTSSDCSTLATDATSCKSCCLVDGTTCPFLSGLSDIEFEHLAPISQTYPSISAFIDACPEYFL